MLVCGSSEEVWFVFVNNVGVVVSVMEYDKNTTSVNFVWG